MALTFVDRSRYNTGNAECMYARYIGYYHEYTGITASKFSVPLTTGGQVHAALEHILYYLKDHNIEIPDTEVRKIISIAQEAYIDEIDESTWSSFDSSVDILSYIASEQTTLLEGLVWCWVEYLIPWIKKDYTIIAVEQEFSRILNCTCGLGPVGSAEDHEDKDCNGICLMTRPDLVLCNSITGNYVYVEFKTGAYVNSDDYPLKFYDNVQFVLGASAVEKAYDKDVTELYVHGLHKGVRRWKDKEKTLKIQHSSICYAYIKKPNPPIEKGDISPTYFKLVDQGDGTTKKWGCTLKRGYEKLPVWEYNFPDVPDAMTPIEHYVRNIMSPEQRQENIRVIGPIDNSNFLSEKLVNQMIHEETRWRARVELIAETAEESSSWDSPETQTMIEELITRSWACKRYGEEFMCTYKPVCFEELSSPPLKDEKYERRDPNHPIEKEIGSFYNKGFAV